MTKNRIFAVINLVIKSLMIGFLVLVVLYTIDFLYLQFFVLPNEYALDYGKSVARIDRSGDIFYCVSLSSTYKCDLLDLIVSYFGWMFFYLLLLQYWFKYYLVQSLLVSGLVLSTSIIYFIKNYDT